MFNSGAVEFKDAAQGVLDSEGAEVAYVGFGVDGRTTGVVAKFLVVWLGEGFECFTEGVVELWCGHAYV